MAWLEAAPLGCRKPAESKGSISHVLAGATGGIGPEDAVAIAYKQATLWQGGTVGAPGTLSGKPPPGTTWVSLD